MALLLVIFGLVTPILAGEPTDHIRKTTDKMISILNDPALKNKVEERRKMLRSTLNERFDWEEMAKRSLAGHWENLTEEEKKEFVPLFTDLLENTYMNRIENYSGGTAGSHQDRAQGRSYAPTRPDLGRVPRDRAAGLRRPGRGIGQEFPDGRPRIRRLTSRAMRHANGSDHEYSFWWGTARPIWSGHPSRRLGARRKG